jgi:hypothetical protein
MATRLWQGSAPPCNTPLGESGFDVLVLTALQHQLPPSCFPDLRLISVGLDDTKNPPTEFEILEANRAAGEASRYWRRGARILVTCQMGLNRSGLVTALLLRDALGCTGLQARHWVQQARVVMTDDYGPLHALFNDHFAAYLDSLPAPPRPRWYVGLPDDPTPEQLAAI